MQFERNPTEVAARYRVLKVAETAFELRAGSTSHALKRGGAFLHFWTKPAAVGWHAERGKDPFYAITLVVTEINIGHRGEEGWSSSLVDDCFFVIDGEALRYVPLPELTVLSEEQFKIRKARLAAEKGVTEVRDDSDPPLAFATITHCRALPELDCAESLDCAIGIPQSHFEKLVEGCRLGRISAAHFHGIGAALSSSFEYGALRDLIVFAGGEIDVHIDSLSFEYRV